MTQVPALIVSTAAGMLVSKAGVIGSTDKAVFAQLGGYPNALAMSAFLTAALSLLPGIPMVPFLAIAVISGGAAWQMRNRKAVEEVRAQEAARTAPLPAEEPVAAALRLDDIRLELGYALLSLVNPNEGPILTEQIKGLRRQLANEMGFVMPAVRIQDNMQLPSNTYVLRVKEIEAGRGELFPAKFLVMDPRGEAITLPGDDTTEPTFGLPAKWVAENHREEASFRGYTVVDPPTVITTHLTEIMKDNMAELLSHSETQKLLDEISREHQKLVADLIPSQSNVGTVQRVLKNLLAERISIRDLATILEGIAEAVGFSHHPQAITEHVRARLARQISDAATGPEGHVPLVTLSPEWEHAFIESLAGQGEEKSLAMAPSRLQEFIAKVRETFDRHALMGASPVLLTSPMTRPYVRSIVERFRPQTMVLSQNEIHPKARIRTLGAI